MTTTSGAPAGWHQDPTGQFEQRYWDGTQWTEHVSSAGVQSVSQLGAAPSQPVAQVAQPEPEPAPQPVFSVQPVQPVQPAASGPAPGWHPDPTGQFEQRYWDGAQWTDHVAHQGQQGVSSLAAARPVQTSSPEQVQRQVQQQARVATSAAGGGHLMDEPVLVVNQKAKLIEITQEFAVYDQAGNQLGSVVEIGQNAAKKLLRFATNVDQFLTHKFEVRDLSGAVLMTLVRPAKLMKSKVIVGTPTGQEIGTIRQENVLGKIRFAFEVGGQRIGGIQAENWRAWNFSIVDANGQEVARITKTWEGLLKAAFTTADNYVVQIHHRLPEPLRSLVVASALTVDTALKQDSK